MSVLTGHSSPVRWGYISKMLAIYMLRLGSIYATYWIYICCILDLYMLHIGSIDPTCWAYISNELIVSDWYLGK